jgi:hypothetical protein
VRHIYINIGGGGEREREKEEEEANEAGEEGGLHVHRASLEGAPGHRLSRIGSLVPLNQGGETEE